MDIEQKRALREIYQAMMAGGLSALRVKDLLMVLSPDGDWDSLVKALCNEFRQIEAGQGVMFR